MKVTTLPIKKRGFTLIELLVVIAIVACLAGIAASVALKQVDNAKKMASQQACSMLATAIENFYGDNNPLPWAYFPKVDTTVSTDADDEANVMGILLNREDGPANRKKNRSGKMYLEGSTSTTKKGGIYLTATEAGYYDEWEHPYYIIMDFDYNDQITDPFTSQVLIKRKVIVYGLGPDGLGGLPDGKYTDQEVTQDNVYSWKSGSK